MEQKIEKKKRPLNNHQKLIKKFITVEFSIHKGFWPEQMKIADQLLKKYNVDFLLWCPPPNNYKVQSMVWFLTREGKQFLSEQLVSYTQQTTNLSPPVQEILLSSAKISHDIDVDSKPKTLKDFLNYGKKIG